jgi:hypothetical protein
MTKKQYIGFMILAVVCLGGLFYWYSFRPSIIKKDCYNEARDKAIKKRGLAGLADGKFNADDYDTYYYMCLQGKGL